MARQPKPLAEARQNLEASLPLIQARYEAGVRRGDWVTGATSEQSETNYATAMSRVISSKARQTGAREAGNERWMSGALQKGAPIIRSRMQDALSKYEQNFGPIYQRIVQVQQSLPAKTLDPNENIERRLKPIVAAARAHLT